jgi:hypothetical protein
MGDNRFFLGRKKTKKSETVENRFFFEITFQTFLESTHQCESFDTHIDLYEKNVPVYIMNFAPLSKLLMFAKNG